MLSTLHHTTVMQASEICSPAAQAKASAWRGSPWGRKRRAFLGSPASIKSHHVCPIRTCDSDGVGKQCGLGSPGAEQTSYFPAQP